MQPLQGSPENGDVAVPAQQGDVAVPAQQGDVAVLAQQGDVAVPAQQGDVAVLAQQGDVAVPAQQGDVAVPAQQQDELPPNTPTEQPAATPSGTAHAIDTIDLALSGGGFRATLFHLGVIAFLHSEGLLSKVANICSVSGGSILAAHLVTRWKEYTDPDVAVFRLAVEHLVRAIEEDDISGRVLRRSRWRALHLRALDSERLVDEYRRMLSPTKGSSVSRPLERWEDFDGRDDLPSLHLLATHLNTGTMCVFNRSGFSIVAKGADEQEAQISARDEMIKAFERFARTVNIRGQDIARGVAASSAFPPVFSPLSPERGERMYQLTDGGVYDNSGVRYLQQLYVRNEGKWNGKRLVVVSDAGRAFTADLNDTFDAVLPLAARVTDAQGNRISEFDSAEARKFFRDRRVPLMACSIHDTITPVGNHSSKVQQQLGTIRTELDKFSREEVFVLYRHGVLVAQKAYGQHCADWEKRAWKPPEGSAWIPSGNELNDVERDGLEASLVGCDQIKKFSKLSRRLLVYLLLSFAMMLFAGVAAGVFIPPLLLRCGFAPAGDLEVTEAQPLGDWASTLPVLTPVLDSPDSPGKQFEFATGQFGKYLSFLPRRASKLTVALGPDLATARYYVFLERSRGDKDPEYVALQEESLRTFNIPAGQLKDRIRGVLIGLPDKRVEDLKEAITNDVLLRLE